MRPLGPLLVALLATAGCSSAVTPPASTPGPVPNAAAPGSCVAPAGMSSLIDQDFEDEQLPWERKADKVTIYFAVAGMSPEWRSDMEYGSAQWNRSPCLDTRVVDRCPTGANCVTVKVGDGGGDDGNFDAVEKAGYTTGGRIELLDSLSTDQRKNVAVHEMGHAVGLRHRKTEHVLMNGDTYDDVFDPDATDYRNLLFDYGRQDPKA